MVYLPADLSLVGVEFGQQTALRFDRLYLVLGGPSN